MWEGEGLATSHSVQFFLFVFRFAADEVAEAEQVDSGLVATPDHTSSPTITSTPVVKVGR